MVAAGASPRMSSLLPACFRRAEEEQVAGALLKREERTPAILAVSQCAVMLSGNAASSYTSTSSSGERRPSMRAETTISRLRVAPIFLALPVWALIVNIHVFKGNGGSDEGLVTNHLTSIRSSNDFRVLFLLGLGLQGRKTWPRHRGGR